MPTGREMHLTKQIGEYLVCAELCRRGYIATTFTGNVPEFDILAINKNYETTPIQVKAIRGGSWQFDGHKFMDISILDDGVQIIKGKKKIDNPHLMCIFVNLVAQGKDEFYIFRLRDLQDIVFKNYKEWLDRHDGRRPRNPQSTHNSVSPKDLSTYKENWVLLER